MKKEIETVQAEKVGSEDAEVFANDIELYIYKYCQENDIENLKKESQSVWNSCLRYIYKHVFKKINLKQQKCIDNPNASIRSTYNSYNYDVVLEIVNLYIYEMCMKYDKEVSILGFSTLTGIAEQVIYNWGNERTKLSSTSIMIYKKLNQYREESLSNKLMSGRHNPVGVIAMLNHHYGWASPYTSDSNKQLQVSADTELPKLHSNNIVEKLPTTE